MNRLKITHAKLILLLGFILTNLTGCKDDLYEHLPENIEIVKIENSSVDVSNVNELELNDSDANTGVNIDDNKENVDLILFMGQSNMAGYGGNKDEAPAVSEEAGMEFRTISDPTRLYPIEEPFGKLENNANGLCDRDDGIYRQGSLVSAFVNSYHEKTGNRVVAVSASVGGMAMDLWLIPEFWDDCINRLISTKEWLNNNDFFVEHIYLVWYQGESDISRQVSVEEYSANFNKFMDSFIDEGVEQIFLIVPNRTGTPGDSICDFQIAICEENDNYTLGSDLPSQYSLSEYSKDNIHYVQTALNAFGEDSGNAAAQYTNTHH